jgi:hypothetical protein
VYNVSVDSLEVLSTDTFDVMITPQTTKKFGLLLCGNEDLHEFLSPMAEISFLTGLFTILTSGGQRQNIV